MQCTCLLPLGVLEKATVCNTPLHWQYPPSSWENSWGRWHCTRTEPGEHRAGRLVTQCLRNDIKSECHVAAQIWTERKVVRSCRWAFMPKWGTPLAPVIKPWRKCSRGGRQYQGPWKEWLALDEPTRLPSKSSWATDDSWKEGKFYLMFIQTYSWSIDVFSQINAMILSP